MVLAEEIEQAAAPTAPIVVCRLIGAGNDDDTPLRRIHAGGLLVTGPIRSIRRSLLLPCLLRLRFPRVAARLADRCVVAHRHFVDGAVGGLAGGDDTTRFFAGAVFGEIGFGCESRAGAAPLFAAYGSRPVPYCSLWFKADRSFAGGKACCGAGVAGAGSES
jgi:hypothetical protein